MKNNGIIVINKDLGYTSRDIVNLICKNLNTRKVGHTGTLDPSASGVMVICVGKALKLCEMLSNHDKEYIAGITLGIETDTLDMDGQILKEENVKIEKDKIIEIINSFKGTYIQEVPKYSAVKVNGRKLYEYARSNQDVVLPKKEVTINDIDIVDDIEYKDNKVFFKIKCNVSKGTYIRSLVRDIGNKLNVPAVMNSLVRIKLGNITLDKAYSIKNILDGDFELVNIEDFFPNIKRIIVNDEMAFKIKNGVILDNLFDDNMAFIFDKEKNLLALYKNINGKCRVYKMFV